MFTSRKITTFVVGALGLPLLTAAAQSNVTVSPFASYVPSAAVNPLAGFGLTFGGTTGLALRSSAQLSISNPDSAQRAAGGNRPWGADADVMLFLNSRDNSPLPVPPPPAPAEPASGAEGADANAAAPADENAAEPADENAASAATNTP